LRKIRDHNSGIRSKLYLNFRPKLACFSAIAGYGEPIVVSRAGKFLVIVTLVLTTGLHWAALQTVAWTMMLADHMRTESVVAAMTHTFDGQHPCCLCKAIARAKKAEQEKQVAVQALRLEFVPFVENIFIPPTARHPFAHPINTYFPAANHPPLVPPPRRLAVS
jgi:hypothetical protein